MHRSEKVRFDDIYYPIKASYIELTTDFSKLDDVFSEYNNITIIGSAGSGKTTLLKYIFLNCLKTWTQIPILIELRNLNEYDGNFEKLIVEKILKLKIKADDITFKRTLESGNFLFLLDGYDEIFSSKKQEINQQIEMFVDAYSKNKFLITTRPGSGIEGFSRFYDFNVCILEDKDVDGLIRTVVENGERRDRILELITEPKNNNYFEYLRNPLLLSMFILAFESHPEIPQRKSAFYRNVFDTLYSKHDGITKNSFPREKKTKLQRDDFETILSIFSYLTLYEGQYTFTYEYITDVLIRIKKSSDYEFIIDDLIYDLRTSISILILDGFEYMFPHRSMQEYFTAFFISKLPTDKKSRAYDNLSEALMSSSNDNSFNFWYICYEMDEQSFISLFLMKQINNVVDKFRGKSDLDLVKAYFDLVDPVIILHYVSVENTIKLYRHSSFANALLEFSDVYDYNDFWYFPSTSGCFDRLLSICNDRTGKGNEGTINLGSDSEITNLLIEYGLVQFIKSVLLNMENKLMDWKKSLKKKKTDIDDLLKM